MRLRSVSPRFVYLHKPPEPHDRSLEGLLSACATQPEARACLQRALMARSTAGRGTVARRTHRSVACCVLLVLISLARACDDSTMDNYSPTPTGIPCIAPPRLACNDPSATNFEPDLTGKVGVNSACVYTAYGCTDMRAANYISYATVSVPSMCMFPGCNDTEALNFDSLATFNSGICRYGMVEVLATPGGVPPFAFVIIGCGTLLLVFVAMSHLRRRRTAHIDVEAQSQGDEHVDRTKPVQYAVALPPKPQKSESAYTPSGQLLYAWGPDPPFQWDPKLELGPARMPRPSQAFRAGCGP